MKLNIKLFLLLLTSVSTLYTADAGPVEDLFPIFDKVQGVYGNKDGQTAAHIFILTQPDSMENASIFADMLKENHLLANAVDAAGQSPLHHASRLKKPNMIHVLLHEKVLVNRPDDYGFTPLHKAVESNDKNTVMLILNNNGIKSLNTPNRWGSTPLHQAARMASPDIIKALLIAGADPTLIEDPDFDPSTPLEVAQDAGRADNAAVLQEWMKPKELARTHSKTLELENYHPDHSPNSSPKRPAKRQTLQPLSKQ